MRSALIPKTRILIFTSRYLLSVALLAAAPAFAEYSYSPLYPTTGELTISATGACKFKQTYQANIGLIKDSNNPDPNATIFGALDEDGNLLMALSHQTSEADIKFMSLVQVRDKQGTLISESEKGAIYTALNPDSLRWVLANNCLEGVWIANVSQNHTGMININVNSAKGGQATIKASYTTSIVHTNWASAVGNPNQGKATMKLQSKPVKIAISYREPM